MDHLRFKSDQTAAAYVADELDPTHREEFELHLMSCLECVEDVEGWRAIKNHLPREAVPRNAAPHEIAPAQRAPQQEFSAQASPGTVHVVRDAGGHAPARESHKARPSGPRSPARQTEAGAATAAHDAPVSPRQPSAARWRLASAVAAGVLAGTVGGWYVRSARGPSIDAEHIGFYSLPPLVRGPADCMSLQLRTGVSLLALRIPGAVPDQQLVPVDSEGHDLAPASYSVQIQGDGSWLVRLQAATVREQGIRFEARSPDGTVEPRGCVISAAQQ
jgi:anti-sigma factor RsiW